MCSDTEEAERLRAREFPTVTMWGLLFFFFFFGFRALTSLSRTSCLSVIRSVYRRGVLQRSERKGGKSEREWVLFS